MFSFQSFPLPRSYLALEAGNGYGAVSTKIRRYQTINANVGSAFTYSDNANTGAAITINEDGVYTIGRADASNSGPAVFGFSLNSVSSGATSIALLAWPERIIYSGIDVNVGFVSSTYFFPAGSIIRPHDDGTLTANPANAQLYFIQVSR